MNRNRLKAIALAMGLTLTLATPHALAAENHSAEISVYALDPRFEHLSRISASLSITSGRANCGGSFTIYDIYDGCDSRMTMVLQQYTNSRWESISEWSEDFSGSRIKMMQEVFKVSSGYRYRMTVTAEIFDSSGDVIETVTCDSPIKTY